MATAGRSASRRWQSCQRFLLDKIKEEVSDRLSRDALEKIHDKWELRCTASQYRKVGPAWASLPWLEKKEKQKKEKLSYRPYNVMKKKYDSLLQLEASSFYYEARSLRAELCRFSTRFVDRALSLHRADAGGAG